MLELVPNVSGGRKMSDDELKHWRMLAFIVRCAQRYSTMFAADETEPASVRSAVTDAVAVAQSRILTGGTADEDSHSRVWMVGAAYFDHYDMEALLTALSAFDNAAENTYADLHEDPAVEIQARRNWAAIRLAGLALHVAVNSPPGTDTTDEVHQAAHWAADGEPHLVPAVGADLIMAMMSEVPASDGLEQVFGELWPEGAPADWQCGDRARLDRSHV